MSLHGCHANRNKQVGRDKNVENFSHGKPGQYECFIWLNIIPKCSLNVYEDKELCKMGLRSRVGRRYFTVRRLHCHFLICSNKLQNRSPASLSLNLTTHDWPRHKDNYSSLSTSFLLCLYMALILVCISTSINAFAV